MIAGESRRLSSWEPLSAATCCDGSPFELMYGRMREARQHISTAASALPNSAVERGASTINFGLQSLTKMPHMRPRAVRRHRASESDLLRDALGV